MSDQKSIKALQSTTSDTLVQDLKKVIEQGRNKAVATVNSVLTVTYWQVGKRINKEVLQGQRAEYGKLLVETVAKELVLLYGKSFETRNLRRMMQFASVLLDFEIVVPLARQLSWSHFLTLIPLKSDEARIFYAQKAGEIGLRQKQYEYYRDLLLTFPKAEAK